MAAMRKMKGLTKAAYVRSVACAIGFWSALVLATPLTCFATIEVERYGWDLGGIDDMLIVDEATVDPLEDEAPEEAPPYLVS